MVLYNQNYNNSFVDKAKTANSMFPNTEDFSNGTFGDKNEISVTTTINTSLGYVKMKYEYYRKILFIPYGIVCRTIIKILII